MMGRGGEVGNGAADAVSAGHGSLPGSDALYRTIFDQGPMPAMLVDVETSRILAVNEGAATLYGYSREELSTMTMHHLRGQAPGDSAELVSSAHGEWVSSGHTQHARKGGEVFDVELRSSVVKIAGRATSITLLEDITERTRADRRTADGHAAAALATDAIRASEERYRSLVEHSPEGIVIHEGGIALFANRSAARIAGASGPADLVGRRILDFVPESEHTALYQRLALLRAGHTAPPMQTRWIAVDGRERSLEVSTSRISFDGRLAFQTVFRDTTERLALEAQLRQAQKMEAVGQLAGGIAHDFNNLLTVIQANAEFLLEGFEADDVRRAEVHDVKRAAMRAAQLTRQLLAFSRKQILRPRVLDINAVVESVQPMLSRLIGEDVIVEAELGTTLGSVMADAGQLEQVLLNLAVNARDAMPNGGRITIGTHAEHLDGEPALGDRPAVSAGEYVVLEVRDTGTGIAPDVLPRVFEPFYTTKPTGQGTGLGLSTVFGIVTQSGGHVRVNSVEGEGATFSVYLPRLAEPATVTGEMQAMRMRGGTETILIVEDEDAVRSIARRILVKQGYVVLEADNGPRAIAVAVGHAGPVHLLLSDIVMPLMSGDELASRLVAIRPGTRVLLMSGHADGDTVRRGRLAEGAAFVQKPFSPMQLLHAVREALDQPH